MKKQKRGLGKGEERGSIKKKKGILEMNRCSQNNFLKGNDCVDSTLV